MQTCKENTSGVDELRQRNLRVQEDRYSSSRGPTPKLQLVDVDDGSVFCSVTKTPGILYEFHNYKKLEHEVHVKFPKGHA